VDEDVQGGRPFRRRVLVNTVTNFASNAWAIVVAVATLPLMLHGLGSAGFGRWVLLQSFSASTGWLIIFDSGLGTALTRVVAACSSRRDHDKLGDAIGSGLAAFAFVAIAGVALLTLIGWPLLSHLGRVTGPMQSDFRTATWLLAAQVACEFILQGLSSSLEGLQRLDLSQGVDMVRRTAFAGGAAAAALTTHRLSDAEVAAVASTGLGILLASVLLWRRTRGSDLRVSPAMLREIVTYGGVAALLRPISALYRVMDRIIVGAVLGPSAVSLVEIATQLVSGVSAVLAASSNALLSGSAWLKARSDVETLRKALLVGTRYLFTVTAPLSIGIAILAADGIRLWVGAKYEVAAAPTAIGVLGIGLMAAFAQTGSVILLGTGRASLIVKATGTSVLVNLVLSVVLVYPLGISGVFLATVISFAVNVPWQVIAVCRDLDVRPFAFFRQVIPGVILPLLIEAAICEMIVVAHINPIATLIIAATVGGGAYTAAALRWAVRPEEIRDLWRGLRGGTATKGTPPA
jgi:O-antigen/teichoic acid export membrane protein